jgi:hypothetical protein
VIADVPALDPSIAPARLDHRRHVDVIRLRLVDEAPPASIDGDVTGFAAVEKMRVRQSRAVRLRHERDRRPGGRVMHVVLETGARGRREPDAVTRIRRRRQ